jgi:hypothetical protein
VDDGVDGIDRDRAGAQGLRAPLERRLGIEAGRRRDLLAQDDLDDRPVERADDAEQPLAARGGARERRPDICAKSALPEITALAEPMPVITTLLRFSPCLANRPRSSAR